MYPAHRLIILIAARKTSFFLALVSALGLGIAVNVPSAGAASEDITLSVHVGSASSPLAPAGAACAELQVGQEFPVDVRVDNVHDLIAWELRVSYDSTIVTLEEADFEHFLVSTPPNGQIFPSLFEAETDNSHFLAAAETRGSADSGSGVLVRLRMRAVGVGTSEISIRTDPTVYGPRLWDDKGKPIADDTGDGIFDGAALSGTAAVNDNCPDSSGEDPLDSGAEPGGGGNDPGTGGGPGTGAGDGTAGSGNEPVDVVIGGGSQNGDHPADTASSGNSGTGNSGDSEDGDSDLANEKTDTEEVDGISGPTSARDSADGSSFGLWWYTLIALVVVAVLAALGLAIKSLREP